MKAKVCLVGEATVGKSSLIRRFVFDQFSDAYVATLGAKVVARDIVVPSDAGDIGVKMMIWDIIGETSLLEAYGNEYFVNVQGIVAVCDLTRYSTFERIPIWLDAVRRVAGDVPKVIAVNKVDLRGEVLVLYDEYGVQQYANEVGARWYLTSARTGENVAAMFQALASDVVARARRTVPARDPPAS